jgi:cell wall-associated NlpC family hydrolase
MNPELSRAYSEFLVVPYRHMGRTLKGWDCYGLYRFVLAARMGRVVGSFDDAYQNNGTKEADDSIHAVLKTGEARGWQRIERGQEVEGDGIVFTLGGEPMHCGYVISPGTMLHCMRGRGTCIERYDNPMWTKRIEGLYRWNS